MGWIIIRDTIINQLLAKEREKVGGDEMNTIF